MQCDMSIVALILIVNKGCSRVLQAEKCPLTRLCKLTYYCDLSAARPLPGWCSPQGLPCCGQHTPPGCRLARHQPGEPHTCTNDRTVIDAALSAFHIAPPLCQISAPGSSSSVAYQLGDGGRTTDPMPERSCPGLHHVQSIDLYVRPTLSQVDVNGCILYSDIQQHRYEIRWRRESAKDTTQRGSESAFDQENTKFSVKMA